MSVVRSCVVGWVVVVAGRAGCVNLLLMKSLSMASHFELSSTAVSQVVPLVRSLLSLLAPSGCKLKSSFHWP